MQWGVLWPIAFLLLSSAIPQWRNSCRTRWTGMVHQYLVTCLYSMVWIHACSPPHRHAWSPLGNNVLAYVGWRHFIILLNMFPIDIIELQFNIYNMMYPNGWGYMSPLRRWWVRITLKLIVFYILMIKILATSRLLRLEDKQLLNLQFNRMARLGLVTIKDVMLMPQRILMAFHTIRSIFRIPRGCNFVWDKLKGLSSWYEPISYLDGGAYELDYDLNKWCLSKVDWQT